MMKEEEEKGVCQSHFYCTTQNLNWKAIFAIRNLPSKMNGVQSASVQNKLTVQAQKRKKKEEEMKRETQFECAMRSKQFSKFILVSNLPYQR